MIAKFIKVHGLVLVWVAILAFIAVLWVQDHDARLRADIAVKASETDIKGLRGQAADVQKTADKRVQAIQREASAVRTPSQAIEALPSVLTADIKPEVLPDAPGKVSVEAVPLYQELATCKITAVRLDACTKELDIEKAIGTQKDVEIKALKAKPSFWHHVKTTAITLGIGAVAGYAIANR